MVASQNVGCLRRLSSFELGYIDRGRLLMELDEPVVSLVSPDNGYDRLHNVIISTIHKSRNGKV